MKRFATSILALVIPLLLSAKLYEPAFLTINSTTGIYAVGDTARIYARSTNPGETLHLYITVDGIAKVDTSLVMTEEPRAIYTEVCDRSKWVMARLSPYGAHKNAYTSVGYVVEPQNFKPAFKAPSDLYRYWDSEIRKMRKSQMQVEIKQVECPESYAGKNLSCWHVTLTMPEGRPVNGYVAMPAQGKNLPIVLCTHGATAITSERTRSSLDRALTEASRGAIGMDMNAHGMPDDADSLYYASLAEELKDYQLQRPASREEYYFRLMYLRVIRALDYLTSLSQWDGERVMISGESQGGAQALAAAGIDKRVTHIRASVPAITNLGGWNEGYQSGWPCNIEEMKDYVASKEGQSILPYFDGSLLIARFKGKMYIDVGFIDITCPPNAVFAVYNNALKADKVIFPYVYRRHYGADTRYRKEMESARKTVKAPFNEEFYR